MNNYIMINGVKLELTQEQVAALTAEPVKDDPFERRPNKKYFYIEFDGRVNRCTDEDSSDDDCYAAANYCRDEEKMEQRALHETLDRLLWRYSEQHGGDPEWDRKICHWYVYLDTRKRTWAAVFNYESKHSGNYFCSEEVAEAAIREVVEPFCEAHPEFVW